MASHQFSVFANSLTHSKPATAGSASREGSPVPVTQHEFHVDDASFSARSQLPPSHRSSSPTSVALQKQLSAGWRIGDGMSRSSDADFYEQLIKMKEEHRKTLELCERMYEEKVGQLRGSGGLSSDRRHRSTSPDMFDGENMRRQHGNGHDDERFESGVSDMRQSAVIDRRYLSNIENLTGETSYSTPQVHDEPQCDNREEVRAQRQTVQSTTPYNAQDARKPPSGKPLYRQTDEEYNYSGIPRNDCKEQERIPRNHREVRERWETQSLEGSPWRPHGYNCLTEMDGAVRQDDVTGNGEDSQTHNDTRKRAMDRITNMWEEFSVHDGRPSTGQYSRRARSSPMSRSLVRSSSLTRLPSSIRSRRDSTASDKKWAGYGRITIPQPFSMTIRENTTPTVTRKTKAMLEVEERRAARVKQEELECQKKFKATPPPAHIFLPLFNEIMESKEERRRRILNERHELLQSMQQPFQMTQREEQKKTEEQRDKDTKRHSQTYSSHHPLFKAHPFPAHIFSEGSPDRALEEEEYRRMQKQRRAEELLRSSSLPMSMKLRDRYTGKGRYTIESGGGRNKSAKDQSHRTSLPIEHSFKPRVNHMIPDFDNNYRKFMRSMEQRKQERETTVCEPFNLRTSERSLGRPPPWFFDEFLDSVDQSVYEEKRATRSAKQGVRSRIKRSQHRGSLAGAGGTRPMSAPIAALLSTSMDHIPARHTESSMCRTRTNKLAQKKIQEREMEDVKYRDTIDRRRGEGIKQMVLEKSSSVDGTPSKTWDAKTKQKLEEDRARMRSYKQQLNEMNRRVQERPLLIDQTAQRNAKLAAERKFQSTLGKSGLTMEELKKRGGASQNATYDVLDDDEDEQGTNGSGKLKSGSVRHGSRSSSGSDQGSRRGSGQGSRKDSSRGSRRDSTETEENADNDDENYSDDFDDTVDKKRVVVE